MSLWPLRVFDRHAEYAIVERKLPHWTQSGTVCFITWRTRDSIPESVLKRWHADRFAWLRKHGIDPKSVDWKDQVQQLDAALRTEFVKTFSDRWHRHLDASHGACVLKDEKLQVQGPFGVAFDPMNGRWCRSSDCDINYMMTVTRDAS